MSEITGWSSCGGPSPWWRLPVHTPWLGPDDDLAGVLDAATAAERRPGDTVAVSEKVVVLLTGHGIPRTAVVPGRLAHVLAARVRPVGNSRGISVPEKMQLVLEHQGRARVVLTAALSLLLRPRGRRGIFYRVAGTFARAARKARVTGSRSASPMSAPA